MRNGGTIRDPRLQRAFEVKQLSSQGVTYRPSDITLVTADLLRLISEEEAKEERRQMRKMERQRR